MSICVTTPLKLFVGLTGISVSGTYTGCYKDTTCSPSSRMQAALALNDPQMTVRKCLDLAKAAGWSYAGLAPGAQSGTTNCFAGERLPPAAVNPGCLAACSGNSTERCGDDNCMLSVYSGEGGRKGYWCLEKIGAVSWVRYAHGS